MEEIISRQSQASRLEQLAEECAELGHAALKLARKRRGESPTDAEERLLITGLTAEAGDVLACLDQLEDVLDGRKVNRWKRVKINRWRSRLEEARAAAET